MNNLIIKIQVEEDDVLVAKADAYSFEMAEMELGSLERYYEKYLTGKAEAEKRLIDEEMEEQREKEDKERFDNLG